MRFDSCKKKTEVLFHPWSQCWFLHSHLLSRRHNLIVKKGWWKNSFCVAVLCRKSLTEQHHLTQFTLPCLSRLVEGGEGPGFQPVFLPSRREGKGQIVLDGWLLVHLQALSFTQASTWTFAIMSASVSAAVCDKKHPYSTKCYHYCCPPWEGSH